MPTDDIYAVAVDGTTPWVGSIGEGLARFDGSDWVTYTLPVNIAHPVTPTILISNNAVVDIAIDGSGNKWLATDGSGVAVLDSSNTSWTVYNTTNSGLPDDFVHTVYLDGSDRWFGTLGGGVARLSGGSWSVYNTGNSLLPEDDVLAVAVDANDGQWFATFDTGLTFLGALPAIPVSVDTDPRRAPDYAPGAAKSYYLWLDPETYLWYLAWSGDGDSHTFEGTVVANTSIISATSLHFEAGELDRNATQLTFNLKIDGAYRPFNIQIGETGSVPPTAPFRLTPPQPLPPEILVEADSPLDEGDFVFVTGTLTDTDSPIGHDIVWDMDDGTLITDTLAPSHSYRDDGLFNVTLTITDVHNEVSSSSQVITVNNVAPEVDFFYAPFRPEPGQVLTFTGSIFDPSPVDTHTFEWDFHDGTTNTDSLTVTHSFASLGVYTVTLTATDDDGGVGVVTYTVLVEPFGADFVGYPGVGLAPFTATLFDTSAGIVITRTWDFGDGSPPVITTATSVDHVYDTPGIYDVALTVEGPSGTSVISRSDYIIAVSPIASNTIILEAEDYTRQIPDTGPTWETRTSQLGYSGSGYVQVTPDVDVFYDTDVIGTGSELQYDLGLGITGTYTIWLRGYAANAAGDSVYVGLNGLPITTTDYISEFPPRTWAWRHTLAESGQPATFTIDFPDVHTLYLWMREDGFIIDQIILTTDPNFDPGG